MGSALSSTPAAQPLSKQLIKKGGEAALLSVATALADDADFIALAKMEATRGERIVAAKLTGDNFLLAAPNPTKEEIITSLRSSIDKLTKKPPPPTKLPMIEEPVSPAKMMTELMKQMSGQTLQPLSKPLIKQGGTGAETSIVTAFQGQPAFETLVLSQVEAAMGTRKAAQRLVEGFLLAAPNPTEAEVKMSLQVTASKMVKDEKLKPPAKWTKQVFKKGGLPAISAILTAFPAHAGLKALGRQEMAAELEAFATAYQATYAEPVAKLGQRQAAQKLMDNFILASVNPSKEECELSLQTTIKVLTKGA